MYLAMEAHIRGPGASGMSTTDRPITLVLPSRDRLSSATIKIALPSASASMLKSLRDCRQRQQGDWSKHLPRILSGYCPIVERVVNIPTILYTFLFSRHRSHRYNMTIVIIVLLLLLLLLKPAALAEDRKIKLFINCFRNTASTKERKTEKTTLRINQQLTAELNTSNVLVSYTVQGQGRSYDHTTYEPEPAFCNHLAN